VPLRSELVPTKEVRGTKHNAGRGEYAPHSWVTGHRAASTGRIHNLPTEYSSSTSTREATLLLDFQSSV